MNKNAPTNTPAKHSGHIVPSRSPNPLQQTMISRKLGLFIHFGINTFLDQEWSDGTQSIAMYAPSTIDTDNWAKTASDAGMTYVILVSKHHEGFCLWHTQGTDYSVTSCNNTTDVVAAMAQSCLTYGLKLGIYYSLWDRNFKEGVMREEHPQQMEPTTAQTYVEYMKSHLTELFTHYGSICEL